MIENLDKIKEKIKDYNFLELDDSYILSALSDEIISVIKGKYGVEAENLLHSHQIEAYEYQGDAESVYTDTCGNKLATREIKFFVDMEDDYFNNTKSFALMLTPFKCHILDETGKILKDDKKTLIKEWRNFMYVQYGEVWFNDFKKYIEIRKNAALKRNENNYKNIKQSLEDSHKENERLIDENYTQQIDMLK